MTDDYRVKSKNIVTPRKEEPFKDQLSLVIDTGETSIQGGTDGLLNIYPPS
jgi:hypothetical protein